jgi:hypothetical protein
MPARLSAQQLFSTMAICWCDMRAYHHCTTGEVYSSLTILVQNLCKRISEHLLVCYMQKMKGK